MPLAVALMSGNRNDVTHLLPLVDGITPVAGRSARRVSGPPGSSPTEATTTTATGASCGTAASNRSSPAIEPSTVRGSGDGVGSSSEPSRGCTTTVAYASAENATRSCVWPSSPSPARLSAGVASWNLETILKAGAVFSDLPLDEAFSAVYGVVEVLFGEVVPGVAPREALVADGKGERGEEVADDVVLVVCLILAHHARPGGVPGWVAGPLAYRS